MVRNLTWANAQSLSEAHDLLLEQAAISRRKASANPLARYGQKAFSQNDEDGITLEILRRLGLTQGTYAEYGVGNGLENNTLILASLGWKGFWVGGESLAFDVSQARRLRYLRDWITLENLYHLTLQGLQYLQVATPDVVSLDLDGNDYHFVEALLRESVLPSLFIVEYNAKFIPPTRFVMPYNATHQWDGSDYYGASLTAFVELFKEFGYRLVCCNAQTGSNAFFVKEEAAGLFADVPQNIMDIYVEPRFYLYRKYGHPVSPQTVAALVQ
ncbi:hypothetical protein GJV78_07710 [Escherichia alba]|uniref:Uncharacterized protein n=1 Tax=Intestinirhabdus alba TaxID=2899544 RepID=A0A6L6IKP4_9ENTR|nr:hypothetical protein [Intestinirhabdus alba]